MTQIVDNTNSYAGRSEEVATSGRRPWKAAVDRHLCTELSCSWNRMQNLGLQSPFHQVKGRGRVNQSRENENYSERLLIKPKGTFFLLRFEKIWLILCHSVISIVDLVPGLIPIPDKSRNAGIPQVVVGLCSSSGQVEAEVEGISHELSTWFLKACLYSHLSVSASSTADTVRHQQ